MSWVPRGRGRERAPAEQGEGRAPVSVEEHGSQVESTDRIIVDAMSITGREGHHVVMLGPIDVIW